MSTTILSSYRLIVLSSYRLIVLKSYRLIVLSSYRLKVLSSYRLIVLKSYRPKVLKKTAPEGAVKSNIGDRLQSTSVATLPSCAVSVSNLEGNLVTLCNLLDYNLTFALEVDTINLRATFIITLAVVTC